MKSPNMQVAAVLVCLAFSVAVKAQEPARQSGTALASASDARPPSSEAIIPHLIKFNGTLLDRQDRPLAGPVGVTFALYAQQTGGAALWLETQNVKLDENGNYTVLLGANSANGVPAELFVSGEARWLGIQVGQQPEHERILLVSVPYALKAGDAETLGGLPASAFVTTGIAANTANSAGAVNSTSSTARPSAQVQSTSNKALTTPQAATPCSSLTSDGTAAVNSIALFTTACNVESSVITQASGNVGIGTATPAVAVDVAGNNAGLRLNGTGTHQVTVTSATTGVSGRLGQDANGFFFASDTNGKSVRFLTNNGTLNEWLRVTSAGNIGIGTTTPAAKLDVNGNVNSNSTVSGTQLISTVATGTAPLSVASTTLVPNLNAGMLGGLPSSAFASTVNSNTFGVSQTINSTSGGVALTANGLGAKSIGVAGTSNDINGVGGYFTNSAGGFIFGAVDNSGNPVLAANQSGAYVRSAVTDIHNDTTIGTVLNELVNFTSANTAVVATAGEAGGAIGIAVANAGIGPGVPKATVVLFGEAPCVFDNTAVEADYFQISPTAAGECHDAGAVYPTNGQQVLGRVIKTTVTPPHVYFFGGGEVRSGPHVYNTSGALQAGHVVAGFVILSGGTATVNLTGAAAYTSNTTYGCVATASTAAPVGMTQVSGTSFTLTSTAATAGVNFTCFGN